MIEAEAIDGGDGAKEGEDGGDIRPGLDPFLQPPILKALFEKLPLEELARCRLVCKLWNKESLSTWRSNATLEFWKNRIVSAQKRNDGNRRFTSLGEFLDLWDAGDWGSCPFKKFNLRIWNFKAGDVEQERFLELVGGHITSLTLDMCLFVGRDNFQRILYQAFPKLQFLKIDECEIDDVKYPHPSADKIVVYKEPAFGVHGLKSLDISDYDGFPDSMMAMLSHFHKVRSLHLELEPKGRQKYRNLLETIKLIRAQDQTKLPLKSFDVNVNLVFGKANTTASCMDILKLQGELSLPLQRLKVDFNPEEDIDWDVIRDILQNHSSTLKYLVVEVIGIRNGVHGLCNALPFGFYLENLKELTIRTFRCPGNLNYLKYTPNLRKLKIKSKFSERRFTVSESNNLFSNSGQLEIGDWTLPSLKELILGFEFPLSVRNMKKLMEWMPNVERFEGVELDDVTFSMICNNWKNLKCLEDYGEGLTDGGVVGIGNSHEAGGDEGTQSVPNITKLKDLTHFVTFSSQLTSASVLDGFSKLVNLKSLALGPSTEIGDEAKAALERRKIIFVY